MDWRPRVRYPFAVTWHCIPEPYFALAAFISCATLLSLYVGEGSMDKRVTFRFYKVTRQRRARMTFAEALTQIGNIRRRSDREAHLGTDFYARAEIISPERGAIVGEMTRIQRTNFPSEIDGDNRIPLRTQNPLGHGVVFRYLPASSDLGIQYDPRILSPGRFVQYVGAMLEDAFFDLEPIVRDDMWDKFRNAQVRKIDISIASPATLDRVDRGGAAPAVTSIRNMAEAYEAPKLRIEMSMGGRRNGALSESVKALVRYVRQQTIQDRVDVTKIKARIKSGEERPEDVDLLDDILSVREELELHDRDPETNYNIKLTSLRGAMREWIVA